MKLEVGMYARIKEGKIFKINETNVVGKNYYLDIRETREIIKASYDIIDILEVGDYVNGLPVSKTSEYIGTYEKYIELYGSCSDWENEDIKSVITHEQMEQMAYKVEE